MKQNASSTLETADYSPVYQRAADVIDKPLSLLSIIDFGNGDMKAAFKVSDSDSWSEIKFPSLVAKVGRPVAGCFQSGSDFYLVGGDAATYECLRTGATDRGKIDNAMPLLMHAVRQKFGVNRSISLDVVFTSPSVKQYGQAITEAIKGRHQIRTPGDEIELIEDVIQTITVNKVAAQLEGHRAFQLVKDDFSQMAVIADIGSRTAILTRIKNSGRIVDRKTFDDCGVYGVSNRIVAEESLAGYDGLKRCPNEEDVTNYILGKGGRKAKAAINPQVRACLSEASRLSIEWAGSEGKIFLVGGGAMLPGVSSLFKAKVIPNPQWATVNGLKSVAEKIIERA